MLDAVTEHMELPEHKTYVLIVKGESMAGDHISDGDYVLVERIGAKSPTVGAIVVALNTKTCEATLRHWHPGKHQVCLRASSPEFPDRVWMMRDCRIEGVVIGVLRSYADLPESSHKMDGSVRDVDPAPYPAWG